MHPPAVWVDQHVWASTDSITTAVIKHALLLGTEDGIAGFLLALHSVLGTRLCFRWLSFLGSSSCKDYHGYI